MKRAVYAGSFDPMTNGHLDIIQRFGPGGRADRRGGGQHK